MSSSPSGFLRGARASLAVPALVIAGLLSAGCADPLERSTSRSLAEVEATLASLDSDPAAIDPADPGPSAATGVESFDGSLPGYLAYAFAHRPALRASFERWRAASYRAPQARRLPEPQLTFSAFVIPVETRVGPQRLKLGAMQWFPWPSKLGASGQAAAHQAVAQQRHFEADALAVAAEVSAAYWALWQIRRTRALDHDELTVLRSLSEQVRIRLEVGRADLADVTRLELSISRAEDRLTGLDERERMAAAELVRTLGAPVGTAVPTAAAEPEVAVPQDVLALQRAAVEHPRVLAWASVSDAARQAERAARADRLPSFGVGVDWIITGQAADTSAGHVSPAESGTDSVMVTAGVRIPLWSRAYRAAASEARASDAVARAQALEARNTALAELERGMARVRDGARRTALFDHTLLPQAEAAFESTVLSYGSGRSSLGDLMASERDLLDLQRERVAVQAALGTAWAELERVVGRPLSVTEEGTRP